LYKTQIDVIYSNSSCVDLLKGVNVIYSMAAFCYLIYLIEVKE